MIFDTDKQRQAAYFATFNTQLSRRVLADIVERLGLWHMKEQANLSAQAQVEMMMLAKHILSDAGVWKEIYNNTIIRKDEHGRPGWFKHILGRKK